MNRLLAACFLGVFLSASGCASSGVGDPCTPEVEFQHWPDNPLRGSSSTTDSLAIDFNSTQCDTRLCLSHYFRGRVTCPFGNAGDKQGLASDGSIDNSIVCLAVPGYPGLYTLDGKRGGEFCCPVIGDDLGSNNGAPASRPIRYSVQPQCAGRPAHDAVYCSCRCGAPKELLDKQDIQLCDCPSGFVCKDICNSDTCNGLPSTKYGSYCVRDNANGSQYDKGDTAAAASKCGGDLKPAD